MVKVFTQKRDRLLLEKMSIMAIKSKFFFKYFFTFLLVVSNFSLAKPPIEGGKIFDESKDPTYIKSVIPIGLESDKISTGFSSASGVKLSSKWILTAAHLFIVQDIKNNKFIVLGKEAIQEHFAKNYGKLVKNVYLHHDYIKKQKKLFEHKVEAYPYEEKLDAFAEVLDSGKLDPNQQIILEKEFKAIITEIENKFPDEKITPLNLEAHEADLALIEFYEVKGEKNDNGVYPSLPSSNYLIEENDDVVIAGYGFLAQLWSKGEWVAVSNDELNWNLNRQFMQEKRFIISHVNNSHFLETTEAGEVIEYTAGNGKSLFHPGDSGGGAFHTNKQGETFLVGIHSVHSTNYEFSAELGYRESRNDPINYVSLKEFPEDWGDGSKSLTDYKTIFNVKESSDIFSQIPLNLFSKNSDGSFRFNNPELLIRKYNYKNDMYMIDLRSSENQKFLNTYLKDL